MTPSSLRQRARHEPLFDIHPLTGASVEVFFADRTLETFGRQGSGWFWWSRRPGFAPNGPASGPFPTSFLAYRNALGTALGTNRNRFQNCNVKSDGYGDLLAEREGFEPPIGLHLCRISSAVHSTTLPPLQGAISGLAPRSGRVLEHDPEKWKRFSEKIMLKQKDRSG
jgi:hypothetical protein